MANTIPCDDCSATDWYRTQTYSATDVDAVTEAGPSTSAGAIVTFPPESWYCHNGHMASPENQDRLSTTFSNRPSTHSGSLSEATTPTTG